jgi:purine-binding chemotaxis protein CheW
MNKLEKYTGLQPVKASEKVEELQVVSFFLGNEEFGANILVIQEIIRTTPVTRVPNAPHFVEGIINLRGKVIPVIDLRKRLNLFSDSEPGRGSRIMVVQVGGKTTGFIVDSVSQVLRIPTTIIEPPPDVASGVDAEYITGVCKLEDRLLIILDFGKILTSTERKELAKL